jgi:hypothetical protein
MATCGGFGAGHGVVLIIEIDFKLCIANYCLCYQNNLFVTVGIILQN